MLVRHDIWYLYAGVSLVAREAMQLYRKAAAWFGGLVVLLGCLFAGRKSCCDLAVWMRIYDGGQSSAASGILKGSKVQCQWG